MPAHFKSNAQQTIVARKQDQVQLRCDAFGDEPITIEWLKNKQRLTNDLDSRYSIHNNPLQSALISLLVIKQTQRQDNSLYECVTRNQVGKDRLPIELIVQEEPDNIQELQTTQINSRSVTLMWTEPYDGRSSITAYMFQYKKVQANQDSLNGFSHPPMSDFDLVPAQQDLSSGSPEMPSSMKSLSSTSADYWQQASRITMPVAQANSNSTIRSITIEKLEPSTKYVLRALAINSIGQSKFSPPMEFFTEEEAPEMGPEDIRASAINSTSILVSWDELPKSKQPGRIHGYYIGYRMANLSNSLSQQPNFIYKPYIINDLGTQQSHNQQSGPRLEYVINDLRRDTNYEITVVAFNARGSSPSSEFVHCKTIEMEAPKPVKLSIKRESNESIFIEWSRDPTDQNPVDDYSLYQEKNSASQDWLQQRLPGNQTQYKVPGLKCGTRYQFYIIAHNKVGKSLPSEVISTSTSGNLPVIPSKMSLIKMVNSTCLLINLNSFQDSGCRIKTFTVRYRVEKAGPSEIQANQANNSILGPNGLIASHLALVSGQASKQNNQAVVANSQHQQQQQMTSDWITIRPKSNSKIQRANEEDRMEYLCDLSPVGEYTIHVTASNDVGRSEIEYTVLMSSDELRYSFLRDAVEFMSSLPNIFAYIPSILVFLLAGLFVSIASLILYTTVINYYQKFVIMHNQIRASRRAKQDEKRRRKLNNSRHSQKLDLWADEYDDDDEDDDAVGSNEVLNQDDLEADGDDEEDEMTTIDNNSSCSSSNTRRPSNMGSHHNHLPFMSNSSPNGHYMSNLRANNMDASSIDSRCNKQFNNCHMSNSASPDSIHGRFQCLNSKQYVKMNEYTMLPTISGALNSSPHNTGIYGTIAAQPALSNQQDSSNNSLYYSTLRRSSMQTYLPAQRRSQSHIQHLQQQQQPNRRSQNIADIYGYYMAPPQLSGNGQAPPAGASPQQVAVGDEAANSIFVPPQQIIYSAPNIRRQPVFL